MPLVHWGGVLALLAWHLAEALPAHVVEVTKQQDAV